MKSEDFILMPVPVSAYLAVCALLGGASTGAMASGGTGQTVQRIEPAGNGGPAANQTDQTNGGAADNGGGPDVTGEIDAHGHPWSAELHASTKNKTKEGLWRMKVGVSRPAPLPGFPKAEAGAGAAGNDGAAGQAAGAGGAPANDEDDEFAAFRRAAAESDAASGAATTTTARKWTDADLGALCNQAAVKLGDPTPVKEIIAQFIPAGGVAHSRNIPDEKREEFAKAVEAKAGITFAG